MSDTHLQQLYNINPRLILVWELQPYGYHRWHVKQHRADSRTDAPISVWLMEGKEGAYMPVSAFTIAHMTELSFFNQNPVEFVKRLLREQDEATATQDKDRQNEVTAWADYYRRAFARLASGGENNPDSYWSPGVDMDTMTTSQGPKGRNVTRAI